MRKISILLIICVALSAFAVPAHGAVWSERYSRASLFLTHQSWDEETNNNFLVSSLGQTVSGLNLNHVVSEKLELGLWSSLTSSSLDSDYFIGTSDVSLTALNDVRLSADYFAAERLIQIGVSLNLPTGKTELDLDEYLLLLGLADNSKKFIVRRLGQGFNVGGQAFLRPLLGEVRLIAGGGFLYRSAYQVLADDRANYKYGNEFFGRVGLERSPAPVGFRATLEFRAYGKDQFSGTDIFQSGNTIAVSGSLRFVGPWRGTIGGGLLTRSAAKIALAGLAELTEESAQSGRNEMKLYATIGRMLSDKFQLLGRGEFKSVSENDYDENATAYRAKASYVGFGGGFGYQISLNVSGSVLGTYYVGSVDEDNDLTGLGLTVALTYRYW
jgi:hypothetical protein